MIISKDVSCVWLVSRSLWLDSTNTSRQRKHTVRTLVMCLSALMVFLSGCFWALSITTIDGCCIDVCVSTHRLHMLKSCFVVTVDAVISIVAVHSSLPSCCGVIGPLPAANRTLFLALACFTPFACLYYFVHLLFFRCCAIAGAVRTTIIPAREKVVTCLAAFAIGVHLATDCVYFHRCAVSIGMTRATSNWLTIVASVCIAVTYFARHLSARQCLVECFQPGHGVGLRSKAVLRTLPPIWRLFVAMLYLTSPIFH